MVKYRNISKNDRDAKLFKYDSEHKVYCDCGPGHGVVFYNTTSNRDRLICSNCGHYIYKDEKTKLKYKLKERGVNVND